MIAELLAKATCTTYAGIGSRRTPDDVLALMSRIAEKLGRLGWTCRSGAAGGADSAFERGARAAMWDSDVAPEIYLPWPGFRGRRLARLTEPSEHAMAIAQRHHPQWRTLAPALRKLHARNAHQVLGADLVSPAAFVLCWTPDGATRATTAATGGTGQAIRVAIAYNIHVFNLQRDDHRADWTSWLEAP